MGCLGPGPRPPTTGPPQEALLSEPQNPGPTGPVLTASGQEFVREALDTLPGPVPSP